MYVVRFQKQSLKISNNWPCQEDNRHENLLSSHYRKSFD